MEQPQVKQPNRITNLVADQILCDCAKVMNDCIYVYMGSKWWRFIGSVRMPDKRVFVDELVSVKDFVAERLDEWELKTVEGPIPINEAVLKISV